MRRALTSPAVCPLPIIYAILCIEVRLSTERRPPGLELDRAVFALNQNQIRVTFLDDKELYMMLHQFTQLTGNQFLSREKITWCVKSVGSVLRETAGRTFLNQFSSYGTIPITPRVIPISSLRVEIGSLG